MIIRPAWIVCEESMLSLWKHFRNPLKHVLKHPLSKLGVAILVIFAIVAIGASLIAPYRPEEIIKDSSGSWLANERPSLRFWLGTTDMARDIFSQLVYGTRTALIVGLLAALMVMLIGSVVGLVSGYFGDWVDQLIMRLVDVVFGVPFLPFAMVLVTVLGRGRWNIIMAISLLLWQTTCRVVRSQVLSLKTRPSIDAARSAGAGNLRIIFIHLAPNVYPISLLYGVFAVGWAILAEAGLSFLGFGDPKSYSWGRMLQESYYAQALSQGAWWWIFPPGICIILLVMAAYFVTFGVEEIVNPRLRKR